MIEFEANTRTKNDFDILMKIEKDLEKQKEDKINFET